MLLSEFFSQPEEQRSQFARTSYERVSEQGTTLKIAEEFFTSNHSLLESNNLADVITASSLVSAALANPTRRNEYFDFITHLRDKYGKEYSTAVHKKATELSQQLIR